MIVYDLKHYDWKIGSGTIFQLGFNNLQDVVLRCNDYTAKYVHKCLIFIKHYSRPFDRKI